MSIILILLFPEVLQCSDGQTEDSITRKAQRQENCYIEYRDTRFLLFISVVIFFAVHIQCCPAL